MKKYSKYKDSEVEWIGEIPEHWDTDKISYSSYVKGRIGWQGLRAEEFIDKGPYLITGIHFTDEGTINWNSCYHINEERYSEDPKIHVKEKDVLITKDGTIGKVAFINKLPSKASLNSHVLLIRPQQENYYSRFLYWCLKSNIFTDYVERKKTGTTFFGITQEQVERFRFPIPKDQEQILISNYLDNKTTQIDSIISKKQKQIELLEEYKKAVINNAVTKGLNPNVKMKDSGIEWIGDIPEHWEVKRLKFLSKINPTKPNTINKDSSDMVDFLPMEKVSEDGLLELDTERPINELISGFTYFEEGDIILAKITPCFENGKGAIIKRLKNGYGFGSTEFHVLRPKIIDNLLLYFITRSDLFKKYGEASMSGAAGQKRVPSSFLENFYVVYPTEKQEQTLISNYLKIKTTQINNIISKKQKQIELLEEYKTSLISEAVTGKIDVRDYKFEKELEKAEVN